MRHIHFATAFSLLTAACVLLYASPPTLAQGISQILAVTGTTAPDANGTFSVFSTPILNNAGQVAFQATLTDTDGGINDDVGIYRADGIALTQIDREFSLGLTSLGKLSEPSGFNDAGQVVYTATSTTPTTSPTEQIRLGSAGGFTVIAAQGQTAPGGNGKFSAFSPPILNNTGQIAFQGTLTETVGETNDDLGIYRSDGTSLTTIVREFSNPLGTISLRDLSLPQGLNNAGQVVYAATVKDVTTSPTQQLRLSSGGGFTVIAAEGQPAPDNNGLFSGTTTFTSAALTDAGQVAFKARLIGTVAGTLDDQGVFVGSGDAVTQIAREGQAAPDHNGAISRFGVGLAMNESGQIAFHASFRDTAVPLGPDNRGVLIGAHGALIQIERGGQAAPDGNGLLRHVSTSRRPAINASGQAVFTANLLGTAGGTTDDFGLFIADGFDIVQIARSGQSLLLNKIESLPFNIDSFETHRINDAGQVAYRTALIGGSEAIALWTPPDAHWTSGSGFWTATANWAAGITPKSLFDVFLDPTVGATIEGGFGNEYVKSLIVGSITGAQVALNQNSGDLTAVQGPITIYHTGRINLGNERVINAPSLTNNGIISGDGQINATLTNSNTGEIRVASSNHLIFSGTNMPNRGVIDINGQDSLATIEFDQTLTNASKGRIEARAKASLRFDAGLTNDGLVSVSFADATIHGPVTNNGSIGIGFSNSTFSSGDITNNGSIFVSGNSSVLFADDVTNGNGAILHVESGSHAVFFGTYNGGSTGDGNVTIHGDLAPGSSPGISHFETSVVFGPSSNTEIEIEGLNVTGPTRFDQIIGDQIISLDGDLNILLDENYVPDYGNVFPIVTASTRFGEYDQINGMLPAGGDFAFAPVYDYQGNIGLSLIAALPGDANLDGTVDEDDLGLFYANVGSVGDWLNANFNGDTLVDLHDMEIILRNLGRTVPMSMVQLAPNATNLVPEPTTAVMLVFFMLASAQRRVIKRTDL